MVIRAHAPISTITTDPGDLESVLDEASDPTKRGDVVTEPGTAFTGWAIAMRFFTCS